MIKLMLFDQDGTLYDKTNPIIHAVRQKVIQIIALRNQIDLFKAKDIYFQLPLQFKNPFEGLASIGISATEYLEAFDNIDIKKYIRYDSRLKSMLDDFSVEKHIVTFAPRNYSFNLINCLGLSKCFTRIMNIDHIYDFNKGNLYFFVYSVHRGELWPWFILIISKSYFRQGL